MPAPARPGSSATRSPSSTPTTRSPARRRSINGTVGLRVPRDVIKAKCAPYLQRGKPERRTQLVNEDDHDIVRTYGAEYRGIVEYYLLAGDVCRLNRLDWVMRDLHAQDPGCAMRRTAI